MRSKRLLPFYLAIFIFLQFPGCVHVDPEAVNTLKEMSREDKGKSELLEREDRNFQALKKALSNGRLKRGRSGAEVAERYGVPVTALPEERGERWLYKGKGAWFRAPKIHLLFDSEGHLKEWKCLRTDCKNRNRR